MSKSFRDLFHHCLLTPDGGIKVAINTVVALMTQISDTPTTMLLIEHIMYSISNT